MPLWNCTPWRRWNVQTLPSTVQLSASRGTGFCVSSRSTSDSNTSWLRLTISRSLQRMGLISPAEEAR